MSREELVAELENVSQRWHSEEFVVMFLGYLCAATQAQLGGSFETPRLLDSWEKFKAEMGKRGVR